MENELNQLIKLAQGKRTQNAYAQQCGINSATITKIIRESRRPTPGVLFKLASKAQNGVTYIQLMEAAGYFELGTDAGALASFTDGANAAAEAVPRKFTERLLSLMEERGVSAAQLCAGLQLPEASISDWKDGKQKPSGETIVRLAGYFGVSAGYLQGRTDEANPAGAGRHPVPDGYSDENVVDFMASGGDRKRIILSDAEMKKAEDMFRLLFPSKARQLEGEENQ